MASAGEIKAGDAYVEIGTRLDKLRAGLSAAESQMQAAAARMTAIGSQIFIGGAAIATPLALGAKAAADFESAMAEVQKVTDAETMRAMTDEVRRMARTMPMTHEELAGLAADAGRFGIEGPKNLAAFTETAARMGVATDLSSERAGEALARLAALTKTPVTSMENLGSAINELSNNFATSSSEIVDSMLRSSAALSQLGLNQKEMAGISAALNEVSESSQRAGTRLRRVAQELLDPRKTAELAEALGMTARAFVRLRDRAPVEIMQRMARAMAEGTAEGTRLRGVLSTAARQAVGALGQNLEGMTRGLDMSNRAFEEGSSLQREYNVQSKTVNARLKQLWNNVYDAGIAIGTALLPSIEALIVGFTKVVRGIGKFISGNQGLVKALGALATAAITVGGALILLGGAMKAVSAAMAIAKVATYGLSTAITFLTAHPLVAVLTLLAAAGIALATYVGLTSDATENTEDMADESDKLADQMEQAKKQIAEVNSDMEKLGQQDLSGLTGDMEKLTGQMGEMSKASGLLGGNEFARQAQQAQKELQGLGTRVEEVRSKLSTVRGRLLRTSGLEEMQERAEEIQSQITNILTRARSTATSQNNIPSRAPGSRKPIKALPGAVKAANLQEQYDQLQSQIEARRGNVKQAEKLRAELEKVYQMQNRMIDRIDRFREHLQSALGDLYQEGMAEAALQSTDKFITDLISGVGDYGKAIEKVQGRQSKLQEKIRKSAEQGDAERFVRLKEQLGLVGDMLDQMKRFQAEADKEKDKSKRAMRLQTFTEFAGRAGGIAPPVATTGIQLPAENKSYERRTAEATEKIATEVEDGGGLTSGH